MKDVGFVYIAGLESLVSKEDVERMFGWNKTLFDLPEEVKMLAPHPESGAHHRGYSGIGREKVVQELLEGEELKKARTVSDVKESFEFGRDNPDMPNVMLPEDKLPGFHAACREFYQTCDAASKAILSAVAIGLSLPADYFTPYHSASDNQLRLLHYPSVPTNSLTQNQASRINAHTDYDTFTILFQDSTGGLEVQTKDGEWTPVAPIEGTAVINVGDFLQRWSNDTLRSTMHRVRSPPGSEPGGTTPDRYSIPYFIGPDAHQSVSTIPSCITAERPDKYPGTISIGEYINERANKNY